MHAKVNFSKMQAAGSDMRKNMVHNDIRANRCGCMRFLRMCRNHKATIVPSFVKHSPIPDVPFAFIVLELYHPQQPVCIEVS